MWHMVETAIEWIVLVIGVLICGTMIGLMGNIGIMWYLFEYLNVSI